MPATSAVMQAAGEQPPSGLEDVVQRHITAACKVRHVVVTLLPDALVTRAQYGLHQRNHGSRIITQSGSGHNMPS